MFEGAEGGEDDNEAALHVGDAGAAEGVGVEERAALEGIFGFVDGVVVAGEEELERRGGAHADAEGLRGRAGEGDVFEDGAGERGEFGGERRAHAVETGKVIRAGIEVGPGGEEVAERGNVHPASQAGAKARRKRGGGGRGQEAARAVRRSASIFVTSAAGS